MCLGQAAADDPQHRQTPCSPARRAGPLLTIAPPKHAQQLAQSRSAQLPQRLLLARRQLVHVRAAALLLPLLLPQAKVARGCAHQPVLGLAGPWGALKGRQDEVASLAGDLQAQHLAAVPDASQVGLPVALPPWHPAVASRAAQRALGGLRPWLAELPHAADAAGGSAASGCASTSPGISAAAIILCGFLVLPSALPTARGTMLASGEAPPPPRRLLVWRRLILQHLRHPLQVGCGLLGHPRDDQSLNESSDRVDECCSMAGGGIDGGPASRYPAWQSQFPPGWLPSGRLSGGLQAQLFTSFCAIRRP